MPLGSDHVSFLACQRYSSLPSTIMRTSKTATGQSSTQSRRPTPYQVRHSLSRPLARQRPPSASPFPSTSVAALRRQRTPTQQWCQPRSNLYDGSSGLRPRVAGSSGLGLSSTPRCRRRTCSLHICSTKHWLSSPSGRGREILFQGIR